MTRPNSDQPLSDDIVKLVEGSIFGRYPKISVEVALNMYITDEWLVSTPGFKNVVTTPFGGTGRGFYSSSRGGFMVGVIGNNVFRITGQLNSLNYQFVARINTFYGRVSIDENNANQINISDSQAIWVYDWKDNTFTKAPVPDNPDTGLPITPGFISYHDGYILAPDVTSFRWYLSPPNNTQSNWNWGAGSTPVFSTIQTKPDFALACLRAPGRGNLIYVLGENVTEMWYDNGSQIFPYQRSNSVSIDYGCLSSNTIATMDNFIVFLASNEKSGPTILYSAGAEFNRLSTDGIDYKLGQVVNPQSSYGMLTRISGHTCYILTFTDPADNFTLMFDFNTGKFSNLSDENGDYFPAAAIAFYDETYFFVSINDSNIYQMDLSLTTYDYRDPLTGIGQDYIIPRKKLCNHHRQMDTSLSIGNSFTFTVEQGVDASYKSSPFRFITTESGKVLTTESPVGYVGNFLSTERVLENYRPRVDLSLSRDGGETFGSPYYYHLNPLGARKNRVIFYGLGIANDLTLQVAIWSRARVVISNGIVEFRMREGE